MPRRAAFFDVDGTLITVTSLFRFLAHDLAVRGFAEHAYDTAMADLARRKAAGATREQTNRAFYTVFAGRSAAGLAAAGEQWFAVEQTTGELFHPEVLAALSAHLADGDLVVLLSGSFPPCVGPIARFVGAQVVVCTEPEVVAGRYTGEVAVPMVGRNKATAAVDVARRHGIDPADCAAYGDDASDLPVLLAVGHPVVVGDDPVLTAQAARSGWTRLPATAPPAPAGVPAAPSRAPS